MGQACGCDEAVYGGLDSSELVLSGDGYIACEAEYSASELNATWLWQEMPQILMGEKDLLRNCHGC